MVTKSNYGRIEIEKISGAVVLNAFLSQKQLGIGILTAVLLSSALLQAADKAYRHQILDSSRKESSSVRKKIIKNMLSFPYCPRDEVTQLAEYVLGNTLLAEGNRDEGKEHVLKGLALDWEISGESDLATRRWAPQVAYSFEAEGLHEDAEKIFEENLAIDIKYRPGTATHHASLAELGQCYLFHNKPLRAIPLLEEAYSLTEEKNVRVYSVERYFALSHLANAYQLTGRNDDSVRLYEKAIQLLDRYPYTGNFFRRSRQMINFARLLVSMNRTKQAENVLLEVIRVNEHPPKMWHGSAVDRVSIDAGQRDLVIAYCTLRQIYIARRNRICVDSLETKIADLRKAYPKTNVNLSIIPMDGLVEFWAPQGVEDGN